MTLNSKVEDFIQNLPTNYLSENLTNSQVRVSELTLSACVRSKNKGDDCWRED